MLTENSNTFPVLKTERLILRQVSVQDEQEIFLLRSDIEINKYLDRPISRTIDDAKNFIDKVVKSNALYWGITLREKDILVGTICLFGFSGKNQECEIGYELLPGFHGQGIMKEAAEKVIDYAFNTINVKKIEACLHKKNLASTRLLERLAFRNSNKPDNNNQDLTYYHLTSQ